MYYIDNIEEAKLGMIEKEYFPTLISLNFLSIVSWGACKRQRGSKAQTGRIAIVFKVVIINSS